jgi:DNA-binding NarL/FixJ family response regulator
VLVLSSHIEEEYARELLENGATGVGYMLKDRVGEVEEFTEAVRRIAAGEVVLDPSLK